MWIDILKGICMVFVVMSHSRAPVQYAWLYTPFFLSGFFFASGYTFSPCNNYKQFLLRKAKTILLPYWFFGILNAILALIADNDNLLDRLFGLLLSINRNNDDLWFVMCLFTMEIIFYGMQKMLNRFNVETFFPGLVIPFLLCAFGYVMIILNIKLPFQIETACVMLPFMYIGYEWKRYSKTILIRRLPWITSGILIYITFCFTAQNSVNIHAESYSNFFVFLIQSSLGTILIVLCSQSIYKHIGDMRITKCLVFIGQNTFVYYALQSKVIRLIDLLYGKLPFSINDFLRSPIYAFVCCAILAIPAMIINRYFPFILGRKSLKPQLVGIK